MQILQLLAIVAGIIFASAVLLRAAVALTNKCLELDDRIRTPPYGLAIIAMAIALIPAFIWMDTVLPKVHPSSVDFHIEGVLIALPISLVVAGGILAVALATTWLRGIAVAFFLNVIALILLAVAKIGAQMIAF